MQIKFDKILGCLRELDEGTGGGGTSGTVATYAELPLASGYTDKYYIVDSATGIWLVNRKEAGIYKSNGTAWNYIGTNVDMTSLSDGSISVTGSPVVINGANGITVASDVANTRINLSNSQDLRTTASPTFAGVKIGSSSGIAKMTSGTMSTATAGTDYLATGAQVKSVLEALTGTNKLLSSALNKNEQSAISAGTASGVYTTISAGVWTKLPLDSVTLDINSEVDNANDKIIVKKDMMAIVRAKTGSSYATPISIGTRVYVNGVPKDSVSANVTSSFIAVLGVWLVKLNANDYIELYTQEGVSGNYAYGSIDLMEV